MPKAVFHHDQILALLKPLDILHLSRLNRQLHAWLVSKESAHVWIAARKNLAYIDKSQEDDTSDEDDDSGSDSEDNIYRRMRIQYKVWNMPDPPQGLSEPAYARLAFEKQCYVSQHGLQFAVKAHEGRLVGLWFRTSAYGWARQFDAAMPDL